MIVPSSMMVEHGNQRWFDDFSSYPHSRQVGGVSFAGQVVPVLKTRMVTDGERHMRSVLTVFDKFASALILVVR